MLHRLSAMAITAVIAGCAPAMVQAPGGLDEAHLRSTLFAFADDSMLGRRAGTEGGMKATRLLAERLNRAGLEPFDDNGSFYQYVPLVRTSATSTSTLTLGGRPLTYETDFVVASPRWRTRVVRDAPTIYLGTTATDTTGWPSRDELHGRVVVFDRRAQGSVSAGVAPARGQARRCRDARGCERGQQAAGGWARGQPVRALRFESCVR
jgi:hypothetical protein